MASVYCVSVLVPTAIKSDTLHISSEIIAEAGVFISAPNFTLSEYFCPFAFSSSFTSSTVRLTYSISSILFTIGRSMLK